MGQLHFFLGIEFIVVPEGMILSRRKFIKELFDDFPYESSSVVKLSPDNGELLSHASDFRRLIGKLNFLVHTRLDLAFSILFLSQFM